MNIFYSLILWGILFAKSVLHCSLAYALLSLELTQGVADPLPIAVVSFSGSHNLAKENDISTVIRDDLRHSGQFKVIIPTLKDSLPHRQEEVFSSYWRDNKKVDDVLVGQIQVFPNGRYCVRFSLVNVAQGKKQLLKQQVFNEVKADQLRHLAHHISDQIYERLTGIRGIFSTRIAYVLVIHHPDHSLYRLQIADMDGYGAKSLLTSTQPIMSPSWSHNGKQIAYVSFEKTAPRIYIQTIETGERQLISDYPGINGAPAWSPDDKTLALALSKDSVAPKIYLMDLASKRLRQVSFGLSIDTEPTWSSTGHFLLFTSDRGGEPQIYQLTLRTGTVRRVTFEGHYNTRASLSVDGKKMVVLNRRQGMYNVAIQDLDDAATLQAITYSGYDTSPSFSPNGQMVLYESKSGQHGLLGMASIDGRVALILPTPQGDVQDPAWSPFLS